MYTSTGHKFVIFKLNLKPSESGTWAQFEVIINYFVHIDHGVGKELHERTSQVLIIGNIIYQLIEFFSQYASPGI